MKELLSQQILLLRVTKDIRFSKTLFRHETGVLVTTTVNFQIAFSYFFFNFQGEGIFIKDFRRDKT